MTVMYNLSEIKMWASIATQLISIACVFSDEFDCLC